MARFWCKGIKNQISFNIRVKFCPINTNTMIKIALLSFFACFMFFVEAQKPSSSPLSGVVIDSALKQPLEYATVTIYSKGSAKPVTGTTTDKTGHWSINDLAEGTYIVVFEFIGYSSYTTPEVVVGKRSQPTDIRIIRLVRKKGVLEGVTIVSQGKLIENKIDKMVFNAEKDVTSQSGVATDVLKKVPQVSVDADGNVELAGSAGIRFLINGKPSSAFGSSISDVLQSIPASQIKSIEVITNPGAKYDAQGLGGIINIILKTNTARGYNGNLSLTAGTRLENGSFNLNARKDNFGVNAFFSGNARLSSATPYSSDRLTTDTSGSTLFHQDGSSQFERHGFQTGFGFDYTFNKQNNLSGSLAYNNFGNTGNGFTNQDLQVKGTTIPDVVSLANSTNSFKFHNIDAGLNYKRTFAKDDQELEISLNTSIGRNRGIYSNNQSLLPQDSMYYGTKSDNPGKINESEIKIDYTQPLKKDVIFGMGSKVSFYDINSSSAVLKYQPGTNNYLLNNYLSNNLTYNQKVYALYSELSFPVSTLFDAKIGARYERTEINSYYSNAQQQVSIPGYNTLVPSIFFSKKLGDDQTIKLSYSKRIERPDYGDLNPFINTNDPKNLSAGNPLLQPEIGNRYELGYSKEFGSFGSIMVNLFYRVNDHDIQPYIVYYPSYRVGDSLYTNVSVSTRQNIGMEKNAGLNLFADLHFTSKLNIRSNAFFFERHTINIIDKGLNSNSFNYRFNLNATYQFSKNLVAEFFGNFNSSRHEAQGIYPSFTSYSMAIRKQFWNKKGSLALSANNLFSEYVDQKTILTASNFSVNSLRRIPTRSIGLNFAWKFGKLEFKKSNEEKDNNLNGPAE